MDAHCAFAEYSSATVKGLLNRSLNHRSNLERAAQRSQMDDWLTEKTAFLIPASRVSNSTANDEKRLVNSETLTHKLNCFLNKVIDQ
jgi:hypothetical protein